LSGETTARVCCLLCVSFGSWIYHPRPRMFSSPRWVCTLLRCRLDSSGRGFCFVWMFLRVVAPHCLRPRCASSPEHDSLLLSGLFFSALWCFLSVRHLFVCSSWHPRMVAGVSICRGVLPPVSGFVRVQVLPLVRGSFLGRESVSRLFCPAPPWTWCLFLVWCASPLFGGGSLFLVGFFMSSCGGSVFCCGTFPRGPPGWCVSVVIARCSPFVRSRACFLFCCSSSFSWSAAWNLLLSFVGVAPVAPVILLPRCVLGASGVTSFLFACLFRLCGFLMGLCSVASRGALGTPLVCPYSDELAPGGWEPVFPPWLWLSPVVVV